jgi:cell cycle checkpoint protein
MINTLRLYNLLITDTMKSPSAKRQRRTIVLSSDESDSTVDGQPDKKHSKQGTQILSFRSTRSPGSTPTRELSTKPSRSNQTKPLKETKARPSLAKAKNQAELSVTKNASLYKFFNPASQTSSQETVRRSPERAVASPLEEDVIEDDSSDGVSPRSSNSHASAPKPHASSRKLSQFRETNLKDSAVGKSRRFAASFQDSSANSKVAQVVTPLISGSKSWIEAYPPETLDDLAVHKRKVSDVQKWLDNVLSGRERKVCSPNFEKYQSK